AHIAQPADFVGAAYLVAQRRADGSSRAEIVNVDAALTAMPRRLHLINAAICCARPVDFPAREVADTPGTAFAKQSRKSLVAQPASRRERVLQMQLRTVWLRLAECRGARHLTHDAGTAASDDILVEQNDPGPVAGGRQSRKHSCRAGACHQHIACELDGVFHTLFDRATFS